MDLMRFYAPVVIGSSDNFCAHFLSTVVVLISLSLFHGSLEKRVSSFLLSSFFGSVRASPSLLYAPFLFLRVPSARFSSFSTRRDSASRTGFF